MGIKIDKTNEDGTVVVKAEEISRAEKLMTDNYNNGHGVGREKGKSEGIAEVLGKLSFLNIDKDNLDGSLSDIRQQFETLQAGKGKEAETIKQLQTQLEEKTKAFDALKTDHESFKRKSLIDNKIMELANKSKAVNADEIPLLFSNNYQLEINEANEVVVKNRDGNQIFDANGNARNLDDIFTNLFVKEKPHLFNGNGNGGSGGGDDGVPADLKYGDLKSDEDKTAFIQKHGAEAYQKLIIDSLEKQKD